MRALAVLAVLAVLLLLAPSAPHPAMAQDFSITNPQAPVDPAKRDFVRQLQAWWDIHGYYPRTAAEAGDAGTVGLRLAILTDGRILNVRLTRRSGSRSLDSAAQRSFVGGYIGPLPDGAGRTEVDIAVHYLITQGRKAQTGLTPAVLNAPFTITNTPVDPPILAKMMQKLCTGRIVLNGLRNHPIRGVFYDATMIFFHAADGSPWVKFTEVSRVSVSPVVQIGNLVSWTGPRIGRHVDRATEVFSNHYTAWLDPNNHLNGCISTDEEWLLSAGCDDAPGTLDFICADETTPKVEYSPMDVEHADPPDEPP